MSKINIPESQYPYFKEFIGLSKEEMQMLIDGINSFNSKDLKSKTSVTNHIISNSPLLDPKKIGGIISIYFNLLEVKNTLELSFDELISSLEYALIKTNVKKLMPNSEIISNFRELLSSGVDIATKYTLLDLMTENSTTYLNAKIYQDIRPLLNSKGNLLGSVIIHKLKINIKKDTNRSEIIISMDDNDLNQLIERLKKAQENTKKIKKTLNDANFIEL